MAVGRLAWLLGVGAIAVSCSEGPEGFQLGPADGGRELVDAFDGGFERDSGPSEDASGNDALERVFDCDFPEPEFARWTSRPISDGHEYFVLEARSAVEKGHCLDSQVYIKVGLNKSTFAGREEVHAGAEESLAVCNACGKGIEIPHLARPSGVYEVTDARGEPDFPAAKRRVYPNFGFSAAALLGEQMAIAECEGPPDWTMFESPVLEIRPGETVVFGGAFSGRLWREMFLQRSTPDFPLRERHQIVSPATAQLAVVGPCLECEEGPSWTAMWERCAELGYYVTPPTSDEKAEFGLWTFQTEPLRPELFEQPAR